MQQSYSLPTHPRFKNLTGQHFGKLLVLAYAGKTRNGKPLFRCRCSCGNENFVTIGAGLLCGDTVTCGCRGLEPLDGKRFGRWLVLKLSHLDDHGNAFFDCACDCGTTGVIRRSSLLDGTSQSCGCLKCDFAAAQTVDETGRMFGRLTVFERHGTDADEKATWRCVCVCGNEIVTSGHHLRCGNTRSCGCLRADLAADLQTWNITPPRLTHGATIGGKATLEYHSWSGMIQRCTNPNSPKWSEYGGRRISVCPQWRFSFSTFLADMGPKPTDKHSLDRVEVHGDYHPDNCRWATAVEQANNKQKPKRSDEEKSLQRKAHAAISYAVSKGRLNRAATFLCVSCNNQAHEWHHHLGYQPEHWLDVIPLCLSCHRSLKV